MTCRPSRRGWTGADETASTTHLLLAEREVLVAEVRGHDREGSKQRLDNVGAQVRVCQS